MLKIAVAHSIEIDTDDALQEVLEQCDATLGSLMAQAGILFVGIDHEYELILENINAKYPGIELIGGTTDGELSSVHGYTDDSISLMLFSSDQLEFKAGVAESITDETSKTVQQAADLVKVQLRKGPEMCFVIPTGLTASGDKVVKGFQSSLGDNLPIFGGGAGDQWRFGDTFQFCNATVYKDSVPFLLIAGPILYSFGIETGWIPIGKQAIVTDSTDHVVEKIGDDDALEFYKRHLGESILQGDGGIIGEYPLAVFDENEERFYLRAPIFEAGSGSLRFLGDVPQGATVQITHSTRDKILDATKVSVNSSVKDYPGTAPAGAICLSCAARKQVLGTRVEEEYNAFKEKFPDIPVAGFYTYGEISPLQKGHVSRYHNETFVTLIIGVE